MGNKLDGNDLNRFLATAGGPTPKTGNDLEGNPLLPSPGETIDSPWGQATVNRLIPRYSTEAVRDGTLLDPDEGQVCYVVEVDEIQIFDGTAWARIGDGEYLPLAGGVLSGQLSIIRAGINILEFQNLNIADDLDGSRVMLVMSSGLIIRTGSIDGSVALHNAVHIAPSNTKFYGIENTSATFSVANETGSGATHDFRFSIQSDGTLRLLSSPKGAESWSIVEVWTAATAVENLPDD